MKICVGIDPGLSGAFAAVQLDGPSLGVWQLPILGRGKRRELDGKSLSDSLISLADPDGGGGISLVVVEGVTFMRGWGGASGFAFGRGYGTILGVLQSLGLPYETAWPRRWQAAVLPALPEGTPKEQRRAAMKAASIAYVSKRFPRACLLRTPRSRALDDGLADALCIAEFARRWVAGEAHERRHRREAV